MKPLALNLIEMIAQNGINKIGLRDLELIGCSSDEFFVVVRDNELFVLRRESPRAYAAIKCASLTNVALDVVALLTEWLPIAKIIGAASRSRSFVVWAEFNVWFLRSAVCAFVSVLRLELFPLGFAELCPWFTLLTYVQTLQLVAIAFFPDRGETFFALQLTQATEDISIRTLSALSAEGIDGCADFVLGQDWARNPMTSGPKCFKDYRIIEFVHRSCRNKAVLGIGKPLFSPSLRLIRRGSRREEKTLAGARLTHFAVRL
ncbi:MAG TPA: hypothetical protein VGK21_02120 [Candidatus Angelobacter sp.]